MESLSRLRNPYVLIVLFLLLLADIGGIVHAFRAHGTRDGIIALILPPYGLYRGVESISHRTLTETEVAELSQSDDGRRELVQGLQIKPDVWEALLAFIAEHRTHELKTTMEETGGTVYDITATVPPDGPITLTIQSRSNADLTISMTDADRDQRPEMLRIVKQVNGQPEVHDTPIDKYTSADASQFLFAWSLAWGTIAEEQQAKANAPSS